MNLLINITDGLSVRATEALSAACPEDLTPWRNGAGHRPKGQGVADANREARTLLRTESREPGSWEFQGGTDEAVRKQGHHVRQKLGNSLR